MNVRIGPVSAAEPKQSVLAQVPNKGKDPSFLSSRATQRADVYIKRSERQHPPFCA